MSKYLTIFSTEAQWKTAQEQSSYHTSKNSKIKQYQLNHASRLVTEHCKKDVEFIQKSPFGSGHKRAGGRNRIGRGIVRANLKRETQKEINDSLYE